MLYGAAYYSMHSLSALLHVAHHVVKQGEAGSEMDFSDVARYMQRSKDRDEAQIRMAFEFLMNYDQLQRPKDGLEDRQINMEGPIERGEVIYFFCPSMGQATTARQVAGLGLYTLLAAAQLRKIAALTKERGTATLGSLSMNSTSWLVGPLRQLLAQSSKFGISLILANQTTTQLETGR